MPDDCKDNCGGNLWKMVQVPHKWDKGRMVESSVRCECFWRKKKAAILTAARIPDRYTHCSLADFSTDHASAHSSLSVARLAAGRFVEDYPIEKSGILFVGPVGVGKTHLACAMLKELIELKGIASLFYSYADMLTEIRNTYSNGGERRFYRDQDGNEWNTESQILNHVIGVEVLLLDELGKVKASEWVLDKVREIIGGRYNKGRTTLATTNFPLAGSAKDILLEHKIGTDMVSRLREMCRVVQVDGADFRQRVQSAGFR